MKKIFILILLIFSFSFSSVVADDNFGKINIEYKFLDSCNGLDFKISFLEYLDNGGITTSSMTATGRTASELIFQYTHDIPEIDNPETYGIAITPPYGFIFELQGDCEGPIPLNEEEKTCFVTFKLPLSSKPSSVQTIPEPSCSEDIWSCENYGSCSPNGIQSRSCRKTFDCLNVETAPPVTSRNCGPKICEAFIYSDWTECNIEGIQLRQADYSFPVGCIEGIPVLTKSCIYEAPICTSWKYSNWSDCSTNEQQTRVILTSYPKNCIGGSPILNQGCIHVSIKKEPMVPEKTNIKESTNTLESVKEINETTGEGSEQGEIVQLEEPTKKNNDDLDNKKEPNKLISFIKKIFAKLKFW